MTLNLVFCANVLRYDCGCQAEWQYIGIFSEISEYHVIPCYKHANNRKEIEKIAAEDWERITSEVTKSPTRF